MLDHAPLDDEAEAERRAVAAGMGLHLMASVEA